MSWIGGRFFSSFDATVGSAFCNSDLGLPLSINLAKLILLSVGFFAIPLDPGLLFMTAPEASTVFNELYLFFLARFFGL